jgi:hypothetical protein
MDDREQFVASEFSNLQRVIKKKTPASTSVTTEPTEPVTESRLMRDLKIVLISTALFLVVGHPKLNQLLERFKLDTITLYTVKASVFALLLFILINRSC